MIALLTLFAPIDKYLQKALKITCFFWFVGVIVQSPGGAEVLNGVEPGGSAGLKLDSVKG